MVLRGDRDLRHSLRPARLRPTVTVAGRSFRFNTRETERHYRTALSRQYPAITPRFETTDLLRKGEHPAPPAHSPADDETRARQVS